MKTGISILARVAALLVTVAPMGCAATSGAGAQRRLPDAARNCLLVRTIDNWEALDAYRLVVGRGSPRNAYEIVFDRRCSAVRHATELRFSSSDDRICDYRSDAVLVDGERCTIAAIRPYRRERANKLPRKKHRY